ncbi:MAG TPA: HEAT repeat domain-containing protein, partial [Fimbriimonadaceae bacterium]|nr:HEAT repeat domain-containing protein [Fimbriimonadaceae bacterium]
IDFETDLDPVPQTATSGRSPFDAEFVRSYLQPRINGGFYEAEDRVYRGPYDSVFLIHGGFAGPAPMAVVNGTAVSPISYYTQGRPQGPEALSGALFDAWVEHLEFAAQKAGYRMGTTLNHRAVTTPSEQAQGFGPFRSAYAVFKGTMWGRVLGRAQTSTDAFLAHRSGDSAAPRQWSEVVDDPFAKLPFLDLERLRQLAGTPHLEFRSVNGNTVMAMAGLEGLSTPYFPNTDLEFGQEACLRLNVPNSTRSILLVDATFAEVFAANLNPENQPLVAGWFEAEGRRFLVVQAENLPSNRPEIALLKLSPSPWDGSLPAFAMSAPFPDDVSVQLSPNGATAATIPVKGGFRVTDSRDPDRGDVLSIQTVGLPKVGSALLVGHRGGPSVHDPAKHRYLSFSIKSTNSEPMILRFAHEGRPDSMLHIFGRYPVPAELAEDASKEIAIADGEGWQSVIVDLSALGSGPVTALWLESDPFAAYWPARSTGPTTVLLDDLRISATASGTPNTLLASSLPAASATAEFPLARALFAATADLANAANLASVIALLQDPSEEVRLNAARAFQRVKSPDAETALAQALTSINPQVASAAADALAFQSTDAAWATLKRAVEIGPFDFTRVHAARALGLKKDSKLAATFSLMLTSPSWRGRAYAAQALGAMALDSTQMVLMAFLHEVDPGARLAVTLAANVSNEEVCKRLLWSAVNDPCDELRALSCFRLVQSGKANYVTEGLKGVRDDSVGMRIRLLELFRGAATESVRPALRLAVADTNPTVRAAALDAFSALSGPVRREEIENAFADIDPRVQASLAQLRRVKGL